MRDNLPKGFRAGTAEANFKNAGRDDLGLIVSDRPCVLAAMFTQNIFRAAPVQVCQECLESGCAVRAVVANSGQANACTGSEGLKNCRETRHLIATALGLRDEEVLTISTGVIGDQLKMANWHNALPALVASLGHKDAEAFTRAFMTTDAFPKFLSMEIALSEGSIRLTVMAKGAGMICPNMATMLCVALSDVAIERDAWQNIFNKCVEKTFNRVSVDGDTSTNDTVLGLANGASGIHAENADDLAILESSMEQIFGQISHMLVKDGEGASKVIRISVTGAQNDDDARKIARSVGNSQLVKTAIYGGDANWGRIVNAVGYSGAKFRPENVTLIIGDIEMFKKGQPVNGDRNEELTKLFQRELIELEIILDEGAGSYNMESSDLGHEYVSLNADYRS